MAGPKPAALPLGDVPMNDLVYLNSLSPKPVKELKKDRWEGGVGRAVSGQECLKILYQDFTSD